MDTNRMEIALITGITGQDGSYLAELLLSKGYEVHGIIRRSSSLNTGRIDHIFSQLHLHYGDITDALSIDTIIKDVMPNEVYHLGAQSHVKVSFEIPGYTAQTDAVGTLNMLEAIRKHAPNCKFYNATTSELFGKVQETPQKETTPFYPRSPYGVAKLYSYWIVKNYRESYGMFAVNGILFNHESPRRGETFVTKKVITKLVEIKKAHGISIPLKIGNLEAKRDWGYAPEFVDGMWRMLQHNKPDDFILATGETHTIRELIKETCYLLDMEISWKGHGLNEVGIWERYHIPIIGIDPKYFRPAEVELLLGDATKAKELLGWEAQTKFRELVKIMVDAELEKYGKD